MPNARLVQGCSHLMENGAVPVAEGATDRFRSPLIEPGNDEHAKGGSAYQLTRRRDVGYDAPFGHGRVQAGTDAAPLGTQTTRISDGLSRSRRIPLVAQKCLTNGAAARMSGRQTTLLRSAAGAQGQRPVASNQTYRAGALLLARSRSAPADRC